MKHWTLWLVALLLAGFGCQSAKDRFPSETRTVFGVPVTVTVFLPDAKTEDLKGAYDTVFNLLSWYEEATLRPGAKNQLEKIAAGAGRESVPADSGVYDLLMRGLQLNDLTGGAFDMRSGPLLDAWQTAGGGKPEQAALDSALSLIKTGGMFVAGRSILLSKAGMRFDVRGFVDAWAIDRAADKLAQRGFGAFEIRTPYACRIVGMPQNEKSREFSLREPQGADSAWATLSLAQGGTAYVTGAPSKDGLGTIRCAVDPRTGELATGSAIVAAKDCATAYALAHAILLNGDATGLSDKARGEVMGSIRISGGKPSYQIVADGSLKDRLRTQN